MRRCSLRLFPVEGIHIGSSSIAKQQECVVGSERQRGIAKVASTHKILQVTHCFRLAVAKANLEHATRTAAIQDINILPVFRNVWPGDRALLYLSPFLGLEIEAEHYGFIFRQPQHVATVR